MQDIERHANDAWASGKQCIAAYDYLRVDVPIELSNDLASTSSYSMENSEQQSVTECESESGEGRKRPRAGDNNSSVAEGFEARNSDGRGRRNNRRFYRNYGRSRGFGNRGRGRPF
jgi:hypothetical protein